MTSDLPNLQDIKADLADRKARGWSVQHGEALVAAVEAVLELHKPKHRTEDDGLHKFTVTACSHCTDDDTDWQWVAGYPCPTVTAIQTTLGGVQ